MEVFGLGKNLLFKSILGRCVEVQENCTKDQIHQKCKETSNWCDCLRYGIWYIGTIVICESRYLEFVMQKSLSFTIWLTNLVLESMMDLAVCKKLFKYCNFCFIYYLHIFGMPGWIRMNNYKIKNVTLCPSNIFDLLNVHPFWPRTPERS